MNKGGLLTRKDIEKTANHLFLLSDWIDLYGKPVYHLRSVKTIKTLLQTKNLDEWDIYRHGYHWYIFLASEKRGKLINDSKLKLLPKDIEKIQATDFSIKGTQRTLAKELKISESHLSRIRRKIRRIGDSPSKILPASEKNKLFISRKKVITFFETMFTVKEFIELFGKDYNIKTSWDVSNMCSNQKNKKLPPGWKAIRVGESWLLYKD